MPTNFGGRQRKPRKEKVDTHEIESVRVRFRDDILIQPLARKIYIYRRKIIAPGTYEIVVEGWKDVWMCQIYPLDDNVEELMLWSMVL